MNIKYFIEEFIKNKVKENNSGYSREPLIGYSSPNDKLYKDIKSIVGQHHIYPEEVLANVKTIVSFFIPFSEKVILDNKKDKKPSDLWIDSYIEINKLINNIAEELVIELNNRNIESATLPATSDFDTVKLVSSWSHRSAAFIAGMGSFGINNILITEKGGAGRYGTIFISKELTPSKRKNLEYCNYLIDKSCSYCIDNCPVHALSLDGFDRKTCYAYLTYVDKKYGANKDSEACGKCVVGPCALYK